MIHPNKSKLSRLLRVAVVEWVGDGAVVDVEGDEVNVIQTHTQEQITNE